MTDRSVTKQQCIYRSGCMKPDVCKEAGHCTSATASDMQQLRTLEGEPALTQSSGLPGTREPVVIVPQGNAGESPPRLLSSNQRVMRRAAADLRRALTFAWHDYESLKRGSDVVNRNVLQVIATLERAAVETPEKRFDPESLAAEAEQFLAEHLDLSDAGFQFRRAIELIRDMLACARDAGPAQETIAEPTADQLRAAEFAEALRLECAKAEPAPGRGLLNMIEGLLSRYAGAQAFERRTENAVVPGSRIEDPSPGPCAADGGPQP